METLNRREREVLLYLSGGADAERTTYSLPRHQQRVSSSRGTFADSGAVISENTPRNILSAN